MHRHSACYKAFRSPTPPTELPAGQGLLEDPKTVKNRFGKPLPNSKPPRPPLPFRSSPKPTFHLYLPIFTYIYLYLPLSTLFPPPSRATPVPHPHFWTLDPLNRARVLPYN